MFEDSRYIEIIKKSQDDDDNFEEEAMFNPIRRMFSKDNKQVDKKVFNKEDQMMERKAKKEKEEVNSYMLEFDELNYKGSQDKLKSNNEKFYDIQHQEVKSKSLDQTNLTIQEYKKRAQEYTNNKRKVFDEMKAVQMAKPEEERIPHYLDQDNNPVPYN